MSTNSKNELTRRLNEERKEEIDYQDSEIRSRVKGYRSEASNRHLP